MKRALFWLLVLSVTCSAACQPPDGKGGGGNSYNQPVNGNTNQPVNGNSNGGPGAASRDKDDKAVAVIVRPTASGGVDVLLSQNEIKLKKDKRKLRFVVINNLEDEIGRVEITFKTTDPFDGPPPFKTGQVKAGEERATQARRATGPVGVYPYNVTVYAADNTTVLKSIDPQVEIVTLTGIEF